MSAYEIQRKSVLRYLSLYFFGYSTWAKCFAQFGWRVGCARLDSVVADASGHSRASSHRSAMVHSIFAIGFQQCLDPSGTGGKCCKQECELQHGYCRAGYM